MTKVAEFMQGRYGNDKLNTFIWIIAGGLYVINLFVRNPILVIIVLLLGALAIFRALSTNITKRLYENNRFLSVYNVVTGFFKRQFMKIRDFKTHRYVTCPYCKAQLRLKKRTGIQQIHCPKCGKDFKKNILF
nr:hypothetical protein [uncultured Ruminococcus sp.]